ncbi:MAG: BamA/TamA family outer membrane protein, partial [Ignavibacteria bacterium]|nr:BamA/TamA family outer membrane protein [Ignavibacteria bacterium]
DRRLLSSLDKPIWDSVANFMMQQITDDIIEEAVLQLPEEYYKIEGEHLISKLKSRRDQLRSASDEYYNWVSKYVDVYCSDKNEFAEVKRVNDLFTEVIIFKRNKKTGEKKGDAIFYRLLKNTVIDELRVHLKGGDDFATITGEVNESCRVIIDGGEGKDELHDSSRVNGYFLGFTPFPSAKKKTEFYDSGKKTTFIESNGTYINQDEYKIPDDPQERYEPLIENRYHDYGVLVPFEYNTDDGLIFGIGGRINYYDFRQKPYSTRLDLSGSYATISQRAEFEFLGDFNNLIGGMNVKVPAKFTGLEITRFYGIGNETVRDDSLLEANYYNVNQQNFNTGFYLKIPVLENVDVYTGLLLEFISVLQQENKLVNELQPYGLGFLDFFALSTSLRFDNRDDKELPFEGYYFDLYADVYPQTLNNKDFFGKIILDGRTYFSSHYITDFTLALRAYSEIAWGEYPFYKGASIGGKKTLRGFARDRYIGDYALMGSAELRYYLAKIYLLIPSKLGMNLFTDTGRVFLSGESSNRWHTSFGGGFWVSIHERAINFSLNFAKSPETFRFYLSIGQMF